MKTYKVEDISTITGANEETVRRWIRSGKLPNSSSLKGESKVVSEVDLISFLRQSPKYMNKAVKNLSDIAKNNKNSLLVGAAIGLIGGGIIALLSENSESHTEVEEQATKAAINTEIQLSEAEIEKKKKEIEKLKEQLTKEQEYLKMLEEKRNNIYEK